MSDVSDAIVKFSTNNNDEKANMTPAFISMNGTVCIRTLSTFILRLRALFPGHHHANFIL